MKKIEFKSMLVSIILVLIIYYFYTPALNIHAIEFWIFIIVALCIYGASTSYSTLLGKKFKPEKVGYLGAAVALIVAGILVTDLFTSKIFHASRYASRIEVENVKFNNKTLHEVDFSKTPIIDRKSTVKLGDKVMGEIPEYVSQFEVSNDYTQISYKNSVYRVTPLEYASFFKYLTNSKNGIPAYITVNSTNGKAEIVKLKDLGLNGMKYVPSAILNHNLNRKLQLSYPTSIFGSPSFEVDEKGHPWYVCTTYTYFGVSNKKKVTGAVLFDPITGKSKKYDKDKVPKWVDRVYPEELIMTEIDENGSLQDGFFNSVLGQKNVTVTSEGYNYLEKDGDIWIYSGITSANKDSSNLGFVLSNLRTHQTLRFSCSGANEKAAMKSAEGEVKNYGYDATFPLLVNVGGHPVYLISLKDSGGLIKQYAMVDAKDYQKVSVYSADSVKNLELLKKSFLSSQTITEESNAETKKKDITIANVQILNVDGKSKLFIVDTEGKKYKAVITSENENTLVFLKAGETIHIRYIEMNDVNVIKSVGE